jgi:putative oxidoreductase
LLILRLWFGLVMAFAHGLRKVTDLSAFAESVGKRGIPFPELTGAFAAASEFLGGVLLAAGLLTRPAAVCLLLTMLVAAFYVHAGDPFSKQELALAYGVAALAVAISGPGRYSIDGWLRLRHSTSQAIVAPRLPRDEDAD